jgi:hypothetical protein
MKKMLLLGIALIMMLSSCLLPSTTAQPEATPLAPASEPDLAATVASSVEQTLEALPTPTLAPSSTPVMVTATQTVTKGTPTETQHPTLLTLTATLGTGTPATKVPGTPGTATLVTAAGLAFSPTVTETAHYQYYGTMPPYLAYSKITLVNKSKSEVYISLQCTTSEGYETIIEYPVESRVEANVPAGRYIYVAWVGGKKITGKFALDNDIDLVINIFKDHLEIK